MAQQSAFPARPGAQIPAGWQGHPPAHAPSGLFPANPPPPHTHPTYREPHPVLAARVLIGGASAAVWLLVSGLLGRDLRGYVLWTLLAGGVAWLVALGLTKLGDRGVAAGIAIVTALGWTFAATAVAVRWSSSADWPLW